MVWFLFEVSNFWCITHEKNVITAGRASLLIDVGDTCKFFYQGSEYTGKVLMKNEDHSLLNCELTRLKKEGKQKPAAKELPTDKKLPTKRKVTPVNFYGTTKRIHTQIVKKSQLSEEEKNRQRILELNKKTSAKLSNVELLAKVKRDLNQDPDWEPEPEEDSQDSVIENVTAHGVQMKADRMNLMKSLGSEPPVSTPSTSSGSPSKEMLKRELEMLKVKLQLAYDDNDSSSANLNKGQISSPILSNNEVDEQMKDGEYRKSPAKDDSPVAPRFRFGDLSYKSNSKDDSLNASGNIENEDDDQHKEGENSHEMSNSESNCNEKKAGPKDESNKNSDSQDTISAESDFADDLLQYQLYGKRDDTSPLCRGIYCKTGILTKALTNASNVNHMLRRLMEGVFIPSKVVDCTVSGRPWRAGGAEYSNNEKNPLHNSALRAICDYSNSVAKKKKWNTKKFEKCISVFSGRLVEIRKQVAAGKLKD